MPGESAGDLDGRDQHLEGVRTGTGRARARSLADHGAEPPQVCRLSLRLNLGRADDRDRRTCTRVGAHVEAVGRRPTGRSIAPMIVLAKSPVAESH